MPKTIWIMWIQGWNKAPDVALTCLNSWKMQNPTWVVRTLSEENLSEFADLGQTHLGIQGKALPPEALADVVRVALLEKQGGIWVDSTLYCNRPLDDWLHDVLPSGFFAFSRPGPDRMVASWFLAATPSHHIAKTWNRLTAEYWLHRTTRHHYFWSHYLFEQAYNKDLKFKYLWDITPKISADGPHYFSPYKKLPRSLTQEDKRIIDAAVQPVFKLTHKRLGKEEGDKLVASASDSVLAYLKARASKAHGSGDRSSIAQG